MFSKEVKHRALQILGIDSVVAAVGCFLTSFRSAYSSPRFQRKCFGFYVVCQAGINNTESQGYFRFPDQLCSLLLCARVD